MPFLEGLDPFSRYQHSYPRSVEFHEAISSVAVDGRQYVRSEPLLAPPKRN
jgi:hypothetical protein